MNNEQLRKKMTEPASEQELMLRAIALTGKTLLQISSNLDIVMPTDLRRAKGWVGELLEQQLGATAASRPEPDFQNLGIELKTLPMSRTGTPKESTFVCTVQLTNTDRSNWHNSLVRKKLARVLWIPIEADPLVPLKSRRIGAPFIWSPDKQQERDMRTDWEEAMDLICMGDLSQLTSRQGKILQIRPKAADSSALTETTRETGELADTLPRGFYLRPTFTYSLLP